MKIKLNKKNWLEWLILGISSVIVVFVFGYLIYSWSQRQTPPAIEVHFGEIVAEKEVYAVAVHLKNKGSKTAQKVQLEVYLITNDSVLETARIEFDYLPGKSSANGWVSFHNNPKDFTLKGRVLGYITP